jgi:hypothetical protein
VGSHTVAATVSGIASPAQFALENYVLIPTTLSINAGSPQAVPVDTAYPTSMKVLVKDQFANPMAGITVTFTAPSSGASGTFADTSTNITTANTNASGIASASIFTANSAMGSYTVEATVSGISSPIQFQLENYIPAATTITVSSGSPQSAPPNTAYGAPLKALVLDQGSTPLSGVTVTFTAPNSGASGVFTDTGTNETTGLTDGNGIATASSFTANGFPGSFSVSATAAGIGTPASFQMGISTGQYVSPAGVDGAACNNPVSPCLTISHAITKARAGQTIFVAQGSYTGSGSYVILLDKTNT